MSDVIKSYDASAKVHFSLGTEEVLCSWRLVLGNLKDQKYSLCPEEMQHFELEESADEIRADWHGHPDCGNDFHVTIQLRRRQNGWQEGGISFAGYSGTSFVEEIHFPVLDFDGTDAEFYSPYNLGAVIRNVPDEGITKPFLHMSFFAASRKGKGIYVEYRDSRHYAKSWELKKTDGSSRCRFSGIHHAGCGKEPSRSFELPYICRFGHYQGAWYEAAAIYREWAVKQSFFTSRTQTNPLRDIALWVWNRGPSDVVVPPVLELARQLPGIRIALDWYWWHENPYDTDYPNFWPPREGVEKFTAAVRQLREQGIFVQTYLNGTLWDSDNPTWSEGGEKEVIQNRDGSSLCVAFNRYNHHRLGFMCGSNRKFRTRLTEQIRHLKEAGLSGQYLDVIGCIDGCLCYQPDHHHSIGGGTYAADGYRSMLADLKKEFPDYPLTTEYCNESFMDLIDGAIVCGATSSEHFGNAEEEPLPIFPAVYHGKNAMALFGNYAHPDGIMPFDPLWPPQDRWKEEKAWHELYPDQFFIEVMRCVVWGIQPMICNLKETVLTDPAFRPIRDFILETARFFHDNQEFLFDGRMLSPAGFSCGKSEVVFWPRMIFTKEKECREIRKELPSLLAALWESPDRSKALFLGNYTGKTQEWSMNGQYGTVPPRSYAKISL